MKSATRFIFPIVIGLVASTTLFGQTGNWWDRFFKKDGKTPVVAPPPVKPAVEPNASALALQEAFVRVAEAIKPAVVNISAVQITRVQENPHQFYFGDPEEFFYRFFGENRPPSRPSAPREFRSEGTGSGVVISPEGHILTNNHVIQGANQLSIRMHDGKVFKGKVVGTDPRTDVAILQIKADQPFAYAPMGDSKSMRIGDWVMAVGSPFGLEQTVTSGIISAVRKSMNIEGKIFRNIFQTDAAINRGNSGGPLVNLKGEVIGINTAIFAPTGVFAGIGFAIPANEAKIILDDLIRKGFVERSWMGVEVAEVDPVIAQQFSLPAAEGALINQVTAGSPAAKAGLKRGDVLTHFNGKKVASVAALQDVVAATPPETKVKVDFIRNGSASTVSLKTEKMPTDARNSDEEEEKDDTDSTSNGKTTDWLGATFAEASAAVRQAYRIEASAVGVVAINVPAESIAADAGIMEGDILQSVNRVPLKKVSDLIQVAKKAKPGDGVVMDVLRRGRSFYLSYKSLS